MSEKGENRLKVRLDRFDNRRFDRGRGRVTEVLWLIASAMVASGLPGSRWRAVLLRLFGARIGQGVVIKPRVRVKFPWRLVVGQHSWVGEGVWIDNLATVEIGAHCCLSQGVYLCTGSHSWRRQSFDLMTNGIWVDDQAWLAAFSAVAPGVHVGKGAVLQLGAVLTANADPWTRYAGNPATACGLRTVDDPGPSAAEDHQ